jgi:hypothetical protein
MHNMVFQCEPSKSLLGRLVMICSCGSEDTIYEDEATPTTPTTLFKDMRLMVLEHKLDVLLEQTGIEFSVNGVTEVD